MLEANYNHTKEKLRAKQMDLSNDENALSDMCQGQEYEAILKEVNDKVEELQVISSLLKFFLFFFFNMTIVITCIFLYPKNFEM